jgi:hypothetical protein
MTSVSELQLLQLDNFCDCQNIHPLHNARGAFLERDDVKFINEYLVV